jgi:DNA ligase-1
MTFLLIEELPIIYGLEKNGKIKIWCARIYSDGNIAKVEFEYGQIDGKKQTTEREYISGKNIGKKNETTPLEQCIAETKKKWQDKIDKESYTTVQSDLEGETQYTGGGKVFPMLAHTYEPDTTKNKKNNIVFPCYVQPKLDGLRCLVYLLNGKCVAQSRTGTYFDTMDNILVQLEPLLLKNPGLIFDGELYTDEIPFEELAGLIKKKNISEFTDEEKTRLNHIKYYIYDVVNDKPYVERFAYIYRTIPKLDYNTFLETVPTRLISNYNEFRELFCEFIGNGYEGIMLRNVDGLYRQNYRSHDLQKYKEFMEAEYPIIGFKEADGRDKGTVIWICRNPDGIEFKVRPKGSISFRKECFKNGEHYVGKQLTVIFQELTELNVPRFPVGKAIRENY